MAQKTPSRWMKGLLALAAARDRYMRQGCSVLLPRQRRTPAHDSDVTGRGLNRGASRYVSEWSLKSPQTLVRGVQHRLSLTAAAAEVGLSKLFGDIEEGDFSPANSRFSLSEKKKKIGGSTRTKPGQLCSNSRALTASSGIESEQNSQAAQLVVRVSKGQCSNNPKKKEGKSMDARRTVVAGSFPCEPHQCE